MFCWYLPGTGIRHDARTGMHGIILVLGLEPGSLLLEAKHKTPAVQCLNAVGLICAVNERVGAPLPAVFL